MLGKSLKQVAIEMEQEIEERFHLTTKRDDPNDSSTRS